MRKDVEGSAEKRGRRGEGKEGFGDAGKIV
jgi:hypothetical protein